MQLTLKQDLNSFTITLTLSLDLYVDAIVCGVTYNIYFASKAFNVNILTLNCNKVKGPY